MPNSYAQSATLTCPQCHQAFDADVWMIVDAQERPDLLEQIGEGALHALPCPHCGYPADVDAPLLLFRPTQTPTLIFSPIEAVSTQQNQHHLDTLLGILRQWVGAAWQDSWVTELGNLQWTSLATINRFLDAEKWEAARKKKLDDFFMQRRKSARCPNASIDQAFTEEISTGDTAPLPDHAPAEMSSWLDVLVALPPGQGRAILQTFASASTPADFERAFMKHMLPAELHEDLRQVQAGEARYLSNSNLAELDAALAAGQRLLHHPAMARVPLDIRLAILNDISNGFLRRYWALGRVADLDQALHLFTKIVEQTPNDSPGRVGSLNNLGISLSDHYSLTGRLEDLEQAVTIYQEAVTQTPANSPDRPGLLNNLSTGLRLRYTRAGRLEDLEQAIAASEAAVAETPTNSPERPMYLSNLGNGFHTRYVLTGRLEDLEQAIAASQQAVVETPVNSPERPIYLSHLGNGFHTRYKHTGWPEDLERAIAVSQQAVAQTSADSPERPMHLRNLGNGFHTRYRRTGRLEDLEQAISTYQEAIRQTPDSAPERPDYLNNLGNGLRDRYALTGRPEDLEQAIAAYQEAVRQTPNNSPERSGYLNNLSIYYGRTGRPEDLDQAIAVSQQAVAQTSANSPERSGYLNNLGVSFYIRYGHTKQLEDLEQAIAAYQEAMRQTPNNSPERPSCLNNLGNSLRDRYALTGQTEDLEQGANSYRQACEQGLTIALENALFSARDWGGWAIARSNWEEASAAYGYSLTAIDRLFAVQLVRSGQESALRLGRGFHVRAAYALARNGDLATAATTVERGRARLLAEALQRNRRDLDLLPVRGHIDLYQRYRNAVEQQQKLLQPTESSTTPSELYLRGLTRMQALEAVQAEIDATITAIQQIPGYEDFFIQPTFAQLQGVVKQTPLVYLLTTSAGGLALIVHKEGVTPVWLALTENALRDLLKEWFDAYDNFLRSRQPAAFQQWLDTIDRVTHRLWDEVMGPLAEVLHTLLSRSPHLESGCPLGAGGEVVTLIPTGLLSLLPLHTAWTDSLSPAEREGRGEGSRRYFLDEFIVNYAPSARALTHARQTANDGMGTHLLAVDEPRPVRGNALPNSAAEVAAIANHFVQPQLFPHEQAIRAAVLAALSQAQVAHFSCHGGTNWENALESGLLMAHDELLTVRDLLELQLPGARLATLSACETGVIGTTLPDEVVALPSALLQAGFAGVVASLWSVADISTAMLMARFYTYWKEEGLAPTQALRSAQRWVRDTTNREKRAYFRDKRPDFFKALEKRPPHVRNFEHPFWWAAFYLTGV